ncbi:class I SAM-dependent methyltransferase [Planctomyces sp. SH-PL62]|uniref:class I SAM-dependent methyltransferase n=1 Tax=Planctomyces sp. SH-PL62 TaxID=1636152 RepID=UPI00078E97CB|nr:class I SAM-dependent methyltransferase [Planctomyces sp. SH-PL62]AMV36149.1 hypothetical protein VT85_01805 [Planctomyces sp. SH-PL62]
MPNLIVKNYTTRKFLDRYGLLNGESRILNAGSSSVRHGSKCVNVDIQRKHDVDVVCDIQSLPVPPAQFDAIVCSAVLQYCQAPERVAGEFHRVLKPGGYVFLDTPWVQPYCPDTPDRFRYSEVALRTIFKHFEIVEIGPSIRPGSAFAMLGVHIAGSMTHNRYINFLLRKAAFVVLFPFRWIRTADESKTAGAFYMICRKPPC